MLEISASVITIDAMGCQKDITSLIIKKKRDDILAFKGNHKLLYKAVKEWFEVAQRADYLGKKYDYYEQVEAGHHRVEKRQVWTVDVSELPPLHNQELWTGLKTVVMIEQSYMICEKLP